MINESVNVWLWYCMAQNSKEQHYIAVEDSRASVFWPYNNNNTITILQILFNTNMINRIKNQG